MAADSRKPNRLEKAEIRKLEAETAEIWVRTVVRAVLVVLGVLALLFGGHLTGWPGVL